jgi:ArsR family transcriptional regulator
LYLDAMMLLAASSRRLKALADETRLRILHLLRAEELACSDLMEVLNMGQSRISTHLTLLKEVGLVGDRRAGRRHLYSLSPGTGAELVDRVLREAGEAPELANDAAGLEALRERRRADSRAYFDRVAASFGEQILPGRTWEGLARALLRLSPRARYVDVGVGDGLLTLMLAEVAESVTAVDISSEMLRQLGQRAERKGIRNLTPVEGELEDLPLPDAAFDVAVLSQALHHADDPARALAEARRVLVEGGRLLVIDLLAHTEEWVREKLQHRHLGFGEQQLERLLADAGLREVSVQRAARDPQPPHLMTLVATGTR